MGRTTSLPDKRVTILKLMASREFCCVLATGSIIDRSFSSSGVVEFEELSEDIMTSKPNINHNVKAYLEDDTDSNCVVQVCGHFFENDHFFPLWTAIKRVPPEEVDKSRAKIQASLAEAVHREEENHDTDTDDTNDAYQTEEDDEEEKEEEEDDGIVPGLSQGYHGAGYLTIDNGNDRYDGDGSETDSDFQQEADSDEDMDAELADILEDAKETLSDKVVLMRRLPQRGKYVKNAEDIREDNEENIHDETKDDNAEDWEDDDEDYEDNDEDEDEDDDEDLLMTIPGDTGNDIESIGEIVTEANDESIFRLNRDLGNSSVLDFQLVSVVKYTISLGSGSLMIVNRKAIQIEVLCKCLLAGLHHRNSEEGDREYPEALFCQQILFGSDLQKVNRPYKSLEALIEEMECDMGDIEEVRHCLFQMY